MNNTAADSMKGRFFHGGLCRLVMGCLLAASGVLGCLQIAGATDAYVQFKGKINALYIANIRIQYAQSQQAIPELVTVVPEQLKYERYPFDQLRQIDFIAVVGEKFLCPAYEAKVYPRQMGHWRQTILMPIREFRGVLYGAPWVYPVDSARGYEDKAELIEKIRFVAPRPGL